MMVYRNATRINTVGSVTRNSSATVTASSITPTHNGTLLAVFATNRGTNGPDINTPPAGMTQRVAIGTTAFGGFAVYDQSLLGVSSSNETMVWGGTGSTYALQLQITNEVEVIPEFVGMSGIQYEATSRNQLIMDKPYGTIQNDLMLAICTNGGGTTTWSGPAGWTEFADLNGRPISGFYYKKAGATESGPYTFTSGTNRQLAGNILTYRYAVYETVGAAASGSATLALPSVNNTISQALLLSVAGRDAAAINIAAPAGMSLVVKNDDATYAPSYSIAQQVIPKGPTNTRSVTLGSATNVNGLMFVVAPTLTAKPTSSPITQLQLLTAYVAASDANTSSVPVPPNVRAGDVLVWSEYVPNYASGAVPTGFTELVNTVATAVNHRTAYKIATGSEVGTTLTGTTGSDTVSALLVFRGPAPYVSASTGTWLSEGTDATPLGQNILLPASGTVLSIAAAGARNTTANITFTTASPAFDDVITGRNITLDAMSVGYKVFPTGGTSQLVNAGDNGTRNTLHSGYLLLST
jgi:hypothetical protein